MLLEFPNLSTWSTTHTVVKMMYQIVKIKCTSSVVNSTKKQVCIVFQQKYQFTSSITCLIRLAACVKGKT